MTDLLTEFGPCVGTMVMGVIIGFIVGMIAVRKTK